MSKDTYTYKEILLGLRDEILETESKLRKLKAFSQADEKYVSNYYYHLSQIRPDQLPELRVHVTRQQTKLMKRLRQLLSRYTYYNNPQSALMVKSNNGVYYPLAGKPFKIDVKPLCAEEFEQLATEILQSSFATGMNFSDIVSTTKEHHEIIAAQWFEPYLQLIRNHSGIKLNYTGRTDTINYASTPTTPLTQGLLDEMLRIEFPKDKFSEYLQEIIEKNGDDRPIVLPETYTPTSFGSFQIIDYSCPEKIILKERPRRKK